MKFLNNKKYESGFTLIEALFYSALLALFLFSSLLFSSNILSATGRVAERNELLVTQEFIEKKLAWIVGQSNGIALPAPGTSNTTLTLTGVDENLFPATFSLVNGQILLSLPGETDVPLTNNRVMITSFLVTQVDNPIAMPAIRIALALSSINLPTIVSATNLTYVMHQ